MGGHGHDNHHEHTNPHAIPEADSAMPLRIREINLIIIIQLLVAFLNHSICMFFMINLIKHNPNLFHVSPFDAPQVYQVLGGHNTLACEAIGGLFGYWYFAQKMKHTPATFYTHILLQFSRIALGAAVGGWIGYMKFGDRQKLHNAWVAERLRRRYPESLEIIMAQQKFDLRTLRNLSLLYSV